jgi:hypothetical protein
MAALNNNLAARLVSAEPSRAGLVRAAIARLAGAIKHLTMEMCKFAFSTDFNR